MPNLGRKLGRYLGRYIGGRALGAPGIGAFPGLWDGVAQADVVAWWDGQDVLQFDTANTGLGGYPNPGDAVQFWRDKSDTGYNIATPGAGPGPVWSADGVDFAGTVANQGFEVLDSAPVDFIHKGEPFSIFLRAKLLDDTVPQTIFSTTAGSSDVGFKVSWRPDASNNPFQLGIFNGSGQIWGGNADIPTPKAGFYNLIVTLDGVWIDGVFTAWSTTTGGFSQAPSTRDFFGIGINPFNNADSFTGEIAQLIILNRAATAADVAQFAAWESPAV